MQNFYYNYIQKKFGDRQTLLMTDTDSLMLEIKTDDFYKEIAPDVEEWFDTSNLPPHLPLETGVNRRVPGKFKDESNGKKIKKFAGPAPKQYAYILEGRKEVKKCKGVTKGGLRGSTKKKEITFDDYKKALDPNSKPRNVEMRTIRSIGHSLVTQTVTKTIFNPKGIVTNNPKRKVLDDNINTLPWGHYRLTQN